MQPLSAVRQDPDPEPEGSRAEPRAEPDTGRPRWGLPRRIAVRFLFTYFVLFFLTGQEIAHIPFSAWPVRKYTELWYAAAVWIGRHVLHITRDFPMLGDGSGDTTFAWLLLPCYLTLAALAAAVWTLLAGRKGNEERLYAWLRFILRFSLALALIVYGVVKAIPSQMPAPRPFTLTQRVGELTPMRLLWTSMGAAPAYQSFTGVAELLAGVLLLFPRTLLLGALIGCADMAMVFTLNLTYDVPVKIMSFHYLLMGVILAAPHLPRLADFFVFHRAAQPAPEPPLLASRRNERIVQLLFTLFGLYVIAMTAYETVGMYRERNPPRPPLYGAWSVEEYVVDGKDVPAAVDPERWRWVVFQRPGAMNVERAGGSRRGYAIDLDLAGKRMILGKNQTGPDGKPLLDAAGKPQRVPDWRAELTFATPEPAVLVLDGDVDGHRLHAKLREAALTGNSFYWILDPPKE